MKRTYNLYLEMEAIEILKTQGIDNFSAFINALLMQEAGLKNNVEDVNSALKLENAKMITKLNQANEKIKELEKKVMIEKSKNPKMKRNIISLEAGR